jgi:hypothetical protein
MHRRLLIASLIVSGLLLLASCGRNESEPGSSRLRAPSMSGEGLDGGVEAGEPASYLKHLP